MNEHKRKPLWDTLSEPTRQHTVRAIMTFFENERDDPIGHIAAEDLLDTSTRGIRNVLQAERDMNILPGVFQQT